MRETLKRPALAQVSSGIVSAFRAPFFIVRLALAIAFFLSGGVTLGYQVVWQRILAQEIGADSISTAIIVSIFMGGLAAGTKLGQKLIRLAPRHVLLIYALTEIAISGLAIHSDDWLRGIEPVFSVLPSSYLVDFLVYGGLLFLPILLMGATTPLVVQIVQWAPGKAGEATGLYYGLNIIGAAAGAFVVSFFFIELYGLHKTLLYMARINFYFALILLAGIALLTWLKQYPPVLTAHLPEPVRLPPLIIASLLAYGFTTLGLELVFFRVASHYFTLVAILFPILLMAFLVNMAAGEWLGALLVHRLPGLVRTVLPAVLFALAALLILALMHVGEPVLAALHINHRFAFFPHNYHKAFLTVAVLLLPILFLSAIIPLQIFQLEKTLPEGRGNLSGEVLFWSTLGNFSGALITSLVLLPTVGTIHALQIIMVMFGIALVMMAAQYRRVMTAPVGAATVVIIVAISALPGHYYQKFRSLYGHHNYPLEVSEDAFGVLSTYGIRNSRGELPRMLKARLNRSPTAGIMHKVDSFSLSRMNLAEIMAIRPSFRPKRILVIGLGSANFAYGLSHFAFVEKIIVAELSQAVIDTTLKYADPKIIAMLNSPKVELIKADGRRYVQQALRRGEKFDFVQIGTFHPRSAGSSNIYSVDFFRDVAKLLTRNGLMATLDYVGVVRAGTEVFPAAFSTYRYFKQGRYMFYAHTPLKYLDARQCINISPELWQAMRAGKEEQLHQLAHPGSSKREMKVYTVAPEVLWRHKLNSDDRPLFEYRALRIRTPRRRMTPRISKSKKIYYEVHKVKLCRKAVPR